MHRTISLCILAVIILLGKSTYAQNCDTVKWCAFKAITITATSGKGAQYVDVDTSWRIRSIDTAITYEAWYKPQQQPGKRIYLAGLWGPNKDNNDVWVAYVENTTVYFALSQSGSYKGDADNTVASVNIPNLYTRGWVHLAFVWDAITQEARIIVDGYEMARARNPQYPVTVLHTQENKQLPLQIGSSNALYDDTVRHRSFLGQIDEVRLWRRALSEVEIRCQRNRSLEGNEKDLELYYRANDSSYILQLCDASGKGHIGQLRSGARMYPSDRTVPATFQLSPTSISATLICINDSSFQMTITDTSFCGNQIYAFFYGGAAGLYTITPNVFNLSQNVPQTLTIRIRNADVTGDLSTGLYFVNTNRCGDYKYVPINIQRTTELSYSKGSLKMDTLYVGCTEKPFAEDSINICNTSNRPILISNARLGNAKFSWRPAPGFTNLPITLQPGQCWKIIVRMDANDTTKTFFDTLKITSDDRCPGSGFVPIEGRTQDVIVLLTPDARRQIKRMDFEAVCPGQTSNVQLYQHRNLLENEDIYIDTIIFTNPAFYGRRGAYPVQLRAKTAYFPIAVRFRPPTPGPFTGQMQVRVKFRGCTIIKTIDLTGTGISVDVEYTTPAVLFGNVSIGKIGNQTATVRNIGKDSRRMSAYLKVGDVFTITSNKSFTITPGQSVNIGVSFRPREQKTYVDTLCVFDEQCYGTLCIPVTGTGVFEQFSFTPDYLRIANIIGCECREDSVVVKNITGAAINITSDALTDPSGKYTLLNRIPTGNFAPGQSFTYRVRYCPNDMNLERADRSYITINLAGGTKYEVLLEGTSLIPKLYMTPLVTYGQVEVGWNKLDSVLIENITSVPVHISSVSVPAGFTLVSTSRALPLWLDPRDSIWAYVRFTPTAQTAYSGNVTAVIDTPCGKTHSGYVTGNGSVVKLDVPLSFINFGLTRPCDCIEREFPLQNKSNFIPITIDSLYIDITGVNNGNATVYSWISRRTGDSTLPIIIPPLLSDTIVVRFCPNVPAIPQNLLMNAALNIVARTPGWKQKFTTILSGRREMNFTPNISRVSFPATRVDTNAAPVFIYIDIPDAFQNPSGDSIVFSGIAFNPDQRVFSAMECSGQPPPWVRKRGEKLCLRVDFRPRAPKKYEARMNLLTSYPCTGVDTTILVTGEGFAPAYGLQLAFDTANIGGDTLHITTCDTLVLPIMTTRDLPQDVIDMLFRIVYDTTAMDVLDCITPFTNNVTILDTGDGARITLHEARKVKAGYVGYVRFIPKNGAAQFPIFLDEVDFDSDSLVFFKIVAGYDRGYVIIDDPQIEISPLADFDTVNIRFCKDQIVTVRNPGLVPIRFDSLSTLPPYHRVTGSSRPLPVTLAPGETVDITVTFCPRMEGWTDTTIYSYSTSPCPIEDTGRIRSYGYAPPFPLTLALDANIGTLDTVGGMITDTIEVPVLMDRAMPMRPIDLRFDLTYNKRALKYIDISSPYVTPNVSMLQDGISVELLGCDTVSAGEIARARFVVCVPDTIYSPIVVTPQQFTSDSIFFIKPVPTGDTSIVKVDPRCNISSLNFTGGKNIISQVRPNPTAHTVEFEFEFFEHIVPQLSLYNVSGNYIMSPFSAVASLEPGRYRMTIDMSVYPSGTYMLVYQAGKYSSTQKVIVTK